MSSTYGATQGDDDHHADESINEDAERRVTSIARRLRLFFRIVTFPILPAGVLVIFSFNMFIVGYVSDITTPHCGSLKAYFWCTVVLAVYGGVIHSRLRRTCGGGPPLDHLLQTFCLAYLLIGLSSLQVCYQSPQEAADVVVVDHNSTTAEDDAPVDTNTCAATCPHLNQAVNIYITSLEILALALCIPLFSLPCIYMWFLSQARSTNAETMALLRERWNEETGNRVTTAQILDRLENVWLVGDDHGAGVVRIEPASNSNTTAQLECCICMNEFQVADVETARQENEDDDSSFANEYAIVRTRACGHLFHRTCIAKWIGGRWQPNKLSEWKERFAKRTTCPLCRHDLNDG